MITNWPVDDYPYSPDTMTETVTNVEGHDVRVVSEADQLEAERIFKRYLLGILASIVITAFWIGVAFSSLRADTTQNTARIEEVRTEGTIPGRAVERRMDALEAQLTLLLERQDEILALIRSTHGGKGVIR